MSVDRANHTARVYRITPWPVRVLIPFLVFVVSLALVRDGAAVAIPIPFLLGGIYIYLAERCGLYVNDSGLYSRMTRRANTFRYPWSEISDIEFIDNGYQCAIVLDLRDSTRKLLPSTQAWAWDKSKVERIYEQLKRDHAAAAPGAEGAAFKH